MTATMDNPQAPPEDGVTEIRVHGVGGQTPQDLLGDPMPTQVAGDRIAGFFRTEDRRGRHLEAYSWGGLTSRSFSRVLWLLLLPFMFANMAGWMARPWPTAKNPRPDRSGNGFQWIARAVALGVTINITVMNCLIALEVVAYQCGGRVACVDTGWLAPLRWASMDSHPGRRLVIGAVFPIVVIGIWAILSHTTRQRYERVEPPRKALPQDDIKGFAEAADGDAPAASRLPGGLTNERFWNGAPAHRRLSRLHLAASAATVALFLVFCAHQTSAQYAVSAANTLFWPVLVLAAGTIVASVVLLGPDPRQRAVSGTVSAAGVSSLLGAGLYAWLQPVAVPPPGTSPSYLPGMQTMFNLTWGLVVVPLLLMLIWCIARAVAARNTPSATDRHVFRWAGPFVVSGVGLILCNIVTLAVIVFVANLFGDISWNETAAVEPGAAAVTIHLYPAIRLALSLLTLGLIAVLLIALIAFGIGYWRAGARAKVRQLAEELRTVYPPPPAEAYPRSPEAWLTSNLDGPVDPPPPEVDVADRAMETRRAAERFGWVASIARWRWLAGATVGAGYVFSALMGIAAVIVGWVCVRFLFTGDAPRAPETLTLGVTIGLAVPPAMVLLLTTGWRQRDSRRIIGVLWDVGTFFPRSFHPFAPPSYSERAVPELQRRIWYLHDHGGRVLLACHSQGSIIGAAAMLRDSPRDDDGLEPKVFLATFGSPLHKLYHWAFPLSFAAETLDGLASGETGMGPVHWQNYYYRTDYIGGPVLVGRDGEPPNTNDAVPTNRPKTDDAVPTNPPNTNDAVPTNPPNTVDVELPDPPVATYVYGQPAPKPGSHTGYWRDPNLLARIDDLADAITGPAQGQTPTPAPTGARPSTPSTTV